MTEIKPRYVDGDITVERHLDDPGYEWLIESLCKKIRDKCEADDRPVHGHVERGHLKWTNGVESDTHVSIVWDDDDIAGIGISTRTAFNATEIITINLLEAAQAPALRQRIAELEGEAEMLALPRNATDAEAVGLREENDQLNSRIDSCHLVYGEQIAKLKATLAAERERAEGLDNHITNLENDLAAAMQRRDLYFESIKTTVKIADVSSLVHVNDLIYAFIELYKELMNDVHIKPDLTEVYDGIKREINDLKERAGGLELERVLKKVEDQRERIVYLEGATNHATGTPLTHALARVSKRETERDEARREVCRLAEVVDGEWGEGADAREIAADKGWSYLYDQDGSDD